MVHSEARTRFDDITKNQLSNTWIFWVNAQMYFPLMVEARTTSVSDPFGSLFDIRSAPLVFLTGIELKLITGPVENNLDCLSVHRRYRTIGQLHVYNI